MARRHSSTRSDTRDEDRHRRSGRDELRGDDYGEYDSRRPSHKNGGKDMFMIFMAIVIVFGLIYLILNNVQAPNGKETIYNNVTRRITGGSEPWGTKDYIFMSALIIFVVIVVLVAVTTKGDLSNLKSLLENGQFLNKVGATGRGGLPLPKRRPESGPPPVFDFDFDADKIEEDISGTIRRDQKKTQKPKGMAGEFGFAALLQEGKEKARERGQKTIKTPEEKLRKSMAATAKKIKEVDPFSPEVLIRKYEGATRGGWLTDKEKRINAFWDITTLLNYMSAVTAVDKNKVQSAIYDYITVFPKVYNDPIGKTQLKDGVKQFELDAKQIQAKIEDLKEKMERNGDKQSEKYMDWEYVVETLKKLKKLAK